MISLVLFSLFSWQVAAGPAASGRSAQSVFDGLRSLMPLMCKPASTLRTCFSVNQETCASRVSSSFETCLRDQKIKFAGQPVLDARAAALAEDNLKKCVLESYSMISMTSYRKSADCDKYVPKVKKKTEVGAKKDPERAQDTAFEDPLDGQRDLVGRYKLRLLHDVRMAEKFRDDLKARATCMNDKKARESNINCYKRMLAGFQITSSVQIPLLGVVAIAAALKDKSEGFSPSNGQLIDVALAAAERAEIEKFHLWNFQATNDSDRVILNQLRVDDEALMKATFVKFHQTLTEKLKAPKSAREPANLSDIKMRVDALKTRKWSYAH